MLPLGIHFSQTDLPLCIVSQLQHTLKAASLYLHTGCDHPIHVGDRFGFVEVTAVTTSDGEEGGCGNYLNGLRDGSSDVCLLLDADEQAAGRTYMHQHLHQRHCPHPSLTIYHLLSAIRERSRVSRAATCRSLARLINSVILASPSG
jgi:hypothetical protein